jgi:ATP-dependent DNA ligase
VRFYADFPRLRRDSLPCRFSTYRLVPYIVERLAELSDGTVVDGELVTIDDSGRPVLHLLQNCRAEAARIDYYISTSCLCQDRDLTPPPSIDREARAAEITGDDPRQENQDFRLHRGVATELLAAVRDQHLEGIVGKRKDSPYQLGKRSGAWIPKLGKGIIEPTRT